MNLHPDCDQWHFVTDFMFILSIYYQTGPSGFLGFFVSRKLKIHFHLWMKKYFSSSTWNVTEWKIKEVVHMKVQSYELVPGLILWNYVLLVNKVSAKLSCMVIRKGVETESNRKKYRQGQNKPIIPWKTSPIPARCLTCPNLTNFHLFFGLIPFLLGPFTRPLKTSFNPSKM